MAQESAPRRDAQEVAQQVLSWSSAPLLAVAMELSNQGGAALCCRRGRKAALGGGKGRGRNLWCGRNQEEEDSWERAQQTSPRTRRSALLPDHIGMETNWCNDSQSDSGLSADLSPCSSLEVSDSEVALRKETPIDREIRRAIEREQSLRRSRGLPKLPAAPEYVDIPLRKPLPADRCDSKDRHFAGKMMHHEIHEDTQREQDLVKLGKLPGSYHKGTVRQLKERKQIFESFQKPSESTLNDLKKSKATSWSSASNVSNMESQEDLPLRVSIGGGPSRRQGSETLNPRGPGFSEGTSPPVMIVENNVPTQRLHQPKPEEQNTTPTTSRASYIPPSRIRDHRGIKESEQGQEEEAAAPRENPFFKLRSSTNVVKVEQDIRQDQERERELRQQRISLYGGTETATAGGQRSTNADTRSVVSLNGRAESWSGGGTGECVCVCVGSS